MIRKPIFSTLTALFGVAVAVPALAHSGEHSMNFFVWLNHILSSPIHLLTLVGLPIFLAVTIVLWRRLKMATLSPCDGTC